MVEYFKRLFSMIEFKKSSVSFIDNQNWIYFAHNEFNIFSLDTNEMIYSEKEPFGKKYNQISNIVYSEENKSVIVISFKGDFCIYQINHKTNKVTKTFTHFQRGNFYCSDVQKISLEKDHITITLEHITLEHKGISFFRSIFFDGKIIDSKYLSPEDYKKHLVESTDVDLFSKTIGNHIVTIKIKWRRISSLKDFPNLPEMHILYISGYVFDDGKEKNKQNFDDTFVSKKKLIFLSSFNALFVSFVTMKGSLIVLPIKSN